MTQSPSAIERTLAELLDDGQWHAFGDVVGALVAAGATPATAELEIARVTRRHGLWRKRGPGETVIGQRPGIDVPDHRDLRGNEWWRGMILRGEVPCPKGERKPEPPIYVKRYNGTGDGGHRGAWSSTSPGYGVARRHPNI